MGNYRLERKIMKWILLVIFIILATAALADPPSNPSGDTVQGYVLNETGSGVNNASIVIMSTARLAVCQSFPACCANCTGSINYNDGFYFSGSDGSYAIDTGDLVYTAGTSGCILGDKNAGDSCESSITVATDKLWLEVNGSSAIPVLPFTGDSGKNRNWTEYWSDAASAFIVNVTLQEIVIVYSYNLSVDKTDYPDPVENGTNLNYTITITNTGNGTITNVTAVETYPANVSFVSATPSASSGNNTWSLGNINAGQTTTINITVKVNSGATNGSTLTNLVNVSFKNDTATSYRSRQSATTVFVNQLPTTTAAGCVPNPANYSQPVVCTLNAGDDIGIGTVLANVTHVNTTIIPQSVQCSGTATSQVCNFTFTQTTGLGRFNVSWWMNDTGGLTNTATDSFNVTDTDSLDIDPANAYCVPDPANISQTVNCYANITDDVGVDTVLANVTHVNSTIFPQSVQCSGTSTLRTCNFSFTQTTYFGQFNITWWANDTSNNQETLDTDFSVLDLDSLNIDDTSLFCIPDPANISDTVTCFANVTDDVEVDTVLANLTHANSTIIPQNVLCSGTTMLQVCNFTFTQTTQAGNYDIIWWANDTSNNQETNQDNFTILDQVPPAFDENATQPPPGSEFNQTDILTLVVCLDENVTVTVNITWDSTSSSFTLTYNGTDYCYTANFTNTTYPDTYNVTFNATDQSGNSNATTTYFTVNDTTNPSVHIIAPPTGTNYSFNATVPIQVNATDPYYNNITSVFANITWDSTYNLTVLVFNASSGLWEGIFSNTTAIDAYNLTIIATDGSGNTNNTETTQFNIQDLTAPAVATGACIPDPANISQSVTCFANFTDNIGLDDIIANVTHINTTIFPQSVLCSGSSTFQECNFTFTQTSLPGTFNITWWVNDTSNNPATGTDDFDVQDVDSLEINNASLYCMPDPANISQTVNCYANLTDDVGIDTVLANVTHANTTILPQNVQCSGPAIARACNFSFTQTTLPGTYNVSWWVNDTSNNQNTATDNFSLQDLDSLDIVQAAAFCIPDPANISNTVICYANVTDDVGVDTVLANLTHANTTIIPQSVQCSGPAIARICNFTFTQTTLPGTYNITWWANDTSNNQETIYDNFSTIDVDSLQVSIGGCNPDPANLTQTVTCFANFSDDVSVDTVLANVTHVNTTIIPQNVQCSGPGILQVCNFTFTQTTGSGQYNITWWVNDTSNNPETGTDSFNINTILGPAFITIFRLEENISSPNWTTLRHVPVLNWSAVPGAEGYNVYYSDNAFSLKTMDISNLSADITEVTGITILNYTDTNASVDRLRFYRVASYLGSDENVNPTVFGKQTFYLKGLGGTGNSYHRKTWIGFVLNTSLYAESFLDEIGSDAIRISELTKTNATEYTTAVHNKDTASNNYSLSAGPRYTVETNAEVNHTIVGVAVTTPVQASLFGIGGTGNSYHRQNWFSLPYANKTYDAETLLDEIGSAAIRMNQLVKYNATDYTVIVHNKDMLANNFTLQFGMGFTIETGADVNFTAQG